MHRVDKLTEDQREALRHVADGYGSKEIARLLHVTSFAIDRRIERAMRTLGVKNRRDAARRLMKVEARMIGDVQTSRVPPDSAPPVPAMSSGETLPGADAGDNAANAASGMYERLVCEPSSLAIPDETGKVEVPERTHTPFPFPFATKGQTDGLSLEWHLFWALVGIPVIVMIAWGCFLSGVNALDALRI